MIFIDKVDSCLSSHSDSLRNTDPTNQKVHAKFKLCLFKEGAFVLMLKATDLMNGRAQSYSKLSNKIFQIRIFSENRISD